MRPVSRKQQGWLLPFCLVYLALGTALILNELDRVILLMRQMNRVIEREQVLDEMERELNAIQQLNQHGDPRYKIPAITAEGETRWLLREAAYRIMVPVLQGDAGRCLWEVELIMLTSLSAGSEREDGWFVYACEWYETGDQVRFYVPQTHW